MDIGVIGPLEVRDGASTIEISGARLQGLLTVLALEAPRAVAPHVLIDALWGDEPPADEANALQSLVSRLRRTLGNADLIQQSPAGYRLVVEPQDVDYHRFAALAASGHDALRAGRLDEAHATLTKALALWRGSLTDLGLNGYADALLTRLDERFLEARGDLAEAQIGLGRAGVVIADLEGLVAANPLRERFTALLMRALTAEGRQAEALASYERTRAHLAETLGADPSAELRAAHAEALASQPAEPAIVAPRNNLRATLTTFVGRDEQLNQISMLLTTSRLVTLVGPGGAGKTRLAGAAASITAQSVGVDGVWLAELAPVTDPSDVPQAVLGALGLRDAILIDRQATASSRTPMTRLVDALAPRNAVLVLDNCEHMIDAAAQLTDSLLAQCPMLRIVATSREPLGIFGEALVVVPPLGQPEPDADPKQALGFPAVELFVDRAADVQPGFEVDETNVASVIEIVRRLDGLPLAIELAAARLRTLPVAEVERRLSDRFKLLTGGSRTAMPRHRTLRAVVEWSWDLLTAPEQLLVERLAVFSGGISPDAASAVCAGDRLDADDIDDLLISLVEKSLLQTVAPTNGVPRYRMLETIREFGVERMAERGEIGAIRLAHADQFANLVAAAGPHLRSREQLEWMALIAAERDNILAALKFLGDDGHAQAAVDLVNLLGWYWMTIGDHGEIVTWVSFALSIPGSVDPMDRLMADAFLAINAFAWRVDDNIDEVAAGLGRLATIAEDIANASESGPKMLVLLAPIVAMFVGSTDLVGPLTERALAHDDPWIAAAVRTFRATMAENNGEPRGMREDAETALAAFRAIGERWGMANSLQVLGQLELMEGNLAAALAAYQEGLDLATAIGGREDIAMMRLRLADILTRLGDGEGARKQAMLAEEAASNSGSPLELLFTHIVQVELARTTGDRDRARALRDVAIARLRQLPPAHPMQAPGLAAILSTAAKIEIDDGQLEPAHEVLTEAYELAINAKDMPIVATVAVAVAMLALQSATPGDCAEILGAATQLRGAEDATSLDIVALNEALGDLKSGPYAEDYRRGQQLSREAALERVNPARLRR